MHAHAQRHPISRWPFNIGMMNAWFDPQHLGAPSISLQSNSSSIHAHTPNAIYSCKTASPKLRRWLQRVTVSIKTRGTKCTDIHVVGIFRDKIFVVEQYLVISWVIFSWLLLALQVKVGKGAYSWVKYSWSDLQPRKPQIFCPTKITSYTVCDMIGGD